MKHNDIEIIPMSDKGLTKLASDLLPDSAWPGLHLQDAERRRQMIEIDGNALRNLVYAAVNAQALLERNGDELSNKAIKNIDEAIAGVRERGEKIWRG